MIPLSIGSATEVYGSASSCQITRHWVDHPLLADASRSLRSLVKSLGDEVADDYWRQTIGPVRKLTFSFCAVPLPFGQLAVAASIDWSKIDRQVRLCQQLFPDSHEPLANLVLQVKQLSNENSSPLIAPLENLLRQCGSLSVMIQNPRMNQAAAAYFSSNPKLRKARVVSAAQLRGANACKVLAAIGPCGWFPEHVFSAPRASIIHIVSYHWIRDGWKPGPVFLHDQGTSAGNGSSHRIGMMPTVSDGSRADTPAPPDIQPADLLPPVRVYVHGEVSIAAPPAGSNLESVPALLCHLSGSRAVFVAAEDGATSLIIDRSETGHSSVRRAPAHELVPGQFLLLRTSGGGDLIAPLADRILGDLASTRRCQQAEWKEHLIAKAMERFGSMERRDLSSRISSELRLHQISQAKPVNVHYWMTAKCIRPRSAEDFAAIMTFAGLGGRTQELWAAMDEIDRAHRRAGYLIRRMLLQKIASMSLESLERDGEMVFDLGVQGGGSLSAFEIASVQEGIVEVSADWVGVLMDMEE